MTVTGKTIRENIEKAEVLDYDVIRSVDNPYSETGGIAVLRGNLAPDGAVVKGCSCRGDACSQRTGKGL